eukprot:TRINITY_DN5518_c0_g1_i2.p1 TRINITY_DN5518_c0_g1~~TRINITY_DN5518_c0_g1_i2.p1  ORF type:complete len:860 (-),score=260.76 TRINITY_DN5518_c0_g1_i2:426-2948(-)
MSFLFGTPEKKKAEEPTPSPVVPKAKPPTEAAAAGRRWPNSAEEDASKPSAAATKVTTPAPAPKKEEAAKSKSEPDSEPKQGKATALVSGAATGGQASAGVSTTSPASATVTGSAKAGPAAAAPKAKTVPPTSAAAVMEQGKKPVTAVERLAQIGSVMASGTGAVPAPTPAPKAKAKAAATPSATAATTPVVSKSLGSGASAAGSLSAPQSVIGIVTQKPMPASSYGASAYPTSTASTSSTVGPARQLAAVAAPFIPSAPTTAPVTGKTVPQEGPAAVAVGRAAAAGHSDPISFGAGKPQVPINAKYQICFVTSEVAPFSKTGGLGEAMDGLPVALAALGHRVMVVSPRYDQYKDAWDTGYWSSVNMGGKQESVHFFHCYKQKVDYVFVDHPTFLERVDGLSGSRLYGPEWGFDFADNQARFAYFCKAAMMAIHDLPLAGYSYGDKCVVVANDWHSALVPMFIHAERSANPTKWAETKSFFLNHNAVFQGRFEREEGLAEVLGVPQRYVDSITFRMPLRVGKYNEKVTCINTMAAGLRYADRALTVSPSYAIECARDSEKGVELEDLFDIAKVTGILNGVKEGVSPADANFVKKTMMTCGTFNAETCAEKKDELKGMYRSQNDLPESPGPLMCFIGRLDAQKGYDLLLEALIDVLQDTDMQVVIVGAGRADLVAQTKAVEKKFPGKFFYGGWMGPERYALLAGCDYTLLPSRWEPCGLVQMEAMRMGTLPIVAPTGGLKDTVEDSVNGLWTDSEMTTECEIEEESVASLSRALRRAAKLHIEEPETCVEMKKAAMAASAEFTWSNAALQYEKVFEEEGAFDLLAGGAQGTVTLEVDNQVC